MGLSPLFWPVSVLMLSADRCSPKAYFGIHLGQSTCGKGGWGFQCLRDRHSGGGSLNGDDLQHIEQMTLWFTIKKLTKLRGEKVLSSEGVLTSSPRKHWCCTELWEQIGRNGLGSFDFLSSSNQPYFCKNSPPQSQLDRNWPEWFVLNVNKIFSSSWQKFPLSFSR